jgi:VanZ family protein
LKYKHFIPAIFWFLGILVLLCLPGSAIPKYPWLAIIHADKWIHIFLFSILGILLNHPLRYSQYSSVQKKQWMIGVMTGCILYGITLEFVQKWWIPNRSFEIKDILADSLGCGLAYLHALWKGWQKGV